MPRTSRTPEKSSGSSPSVRRSDHGSRSRTWGFGHGGRLRVLLALSWLLAVSVALPPVVRAQDADADTGKPMITPDMTPEQINMVAYKFSAQFMSPYCPGKTLRDCTSSQAADLREEIHDWVAQGKSRQWIESQLVDRFGESILAAPKFKGFNALVWLFPFIALLVGLGLVFSYLQRQRSLEVARRVPGPKVDPGRPVDAELEREFERELAEHEK